MAVGYGSMRTVRAEAQARGPNVTADLRLENNRITGTVTNHSDRTLVAPALVFGASAVALQDLAPGATADVSLNLVGNPLNQGSLSDRVVGQVEWDFNGGAMNEAEQRKLIRRSILDQLTFDPASGWQASLASDSPVVLAWGEDPVVQLEIEDVRLQRLANVLYHVPVPMQVAGEVTFRNDLLRSSIVEGDANFFNKDPWTISLGIGSIEMAYRPIQFDGTFAARRVVLALTFGGETALPAGEPTALEEAVRCEPGSDGCAQPVDGLPDIEVLDVRTGAWVQFEHMTQGRAYELSDAGRWVDPSSGEIRIRFVNEHQDGIGFQLPIAISGVVR
jgi:hypothetical protein